jgi:hypothetical protein
LGGVEAEAPGRDDPGLPGAGKGECDRPQVRIALAADSRSPGWDDQGYGRARSRHERFADQERGR